MTTSDAATLSTDGRNPLHREPWLRARTLLELGELTAQWLEGGLTWLPGYNASVPDDETLHLVPILAALNRAGYVTDFSQPGYDLDADRCGQRAAVGGFCDEALADALNAAASGTDLVVLRLPAGHVESSVQQLVVTLDDGQDYTWIGGTTLEHYREDVSPEGLLALETACYVDICDPRWGRNDLLWPTLLRALDESTTA